MATKNLCFSSVSLFNEQIILKAGVFSGSDLAATIVRAFKWFEDVSWILMDSRRSDVQPASTKTFFWANHRSNWEADWQISQNILPPAEAVCDVADADSDAGTNFSQGLFFCHVGRKARRRSSFSYFACFSPASLFFCLAGGADTPSKYRHTLFPRSAVKPRFRVWMLQYIREITAVDNMKIACNATHENTALSTMAPKIMIWSRSKAANLSLFSESSSWMRNE